MRRRRRWLWLSLVVLLAAAAAAALLEPTRTVRGLFAGEAFCGGRPTSYWREMLREEGRQGTVSRETRKRLLWSGGDPVPVLLALTRDSDAHVRWPAIALLGMRDQRTDTTLAAVIAALHDEDLEVRLQAMLVLGRWGKTSRPAVPDLIALLQDPEPQVANDADRALWRIDEAAALEATGWRQFTSKPWDFTAMFPAEPAEEETPDPLQGGLTLHSYRAMHGPVSYSVAVKEYAAEYVETLPEEKRLEAARDGALSALGGKLFRESPVSQNGLKGREHVIEVEGKGFFQSRLFWVGRRLYQVNISYSLRFVNPKAADYFLDSFRIGGPAQELLPAPIPR